MATKKQNKQALLPELRFPDFKKDELWKGIPLEEVSERIRKKVGTKVLTPVSLTAGVGFVDQTKKFGRRIAGEQYKNYIHINRGDFVYNKGNSKTFAQGCIYQLKEFEEAAASTAFICFKLDDRCVDQYFQSLFEFNAHGRELAKFITSGARSDGLLNINPNVFFSIELPVPPKKAEQQKIADCLGSLDDLIAAHSRKLDALQDHKKGLLQQLFPAEGENTPKLRFPEFSGKKGWKQSPLSKLANPVKTRAKGVTINDVLSLTTEHGIVKQTEYFQRKITGTNLDRYFKIREGDFVYNDRTTKASKYGTIKRLRQFATGAVSPIYKCFRFKKNAAVPAFWDYYFESNAHEHALKEYVNEGARAGRFNISVDTFLSITVRYPETQEQQEIAQCLSRLDSAIAAQSDQVIALKAHKMGLMQKLFPNPELKMA